MSKLKAPRSRIAGLWLLLPLAAPLSMPLHGQSVAPAEAQLQAPPAAPAPATADLTPGPPRPGGSGPCLSSPCQLYPGYAVDPPVDLSGSDKAVFYLHRVANLGTILGPAAEAGMLMALPPKNYPAEWRQGAGAFGRNYGAVMGRAQTAEFSRFAFGAILREDPRYYPSAIRSAARRVGHALAFTLIDRSDSGQSRFAFANLIGAASGGFVGDAYLPNSYTDLRHTGVRTGVQMGGFAMRNLADEFAPEMDKLSRLLSSRIHSKN